MTNSLFVLHLLLFSGLVGTAAADASTPVITVNGEASVRAAPDMAVVHTGVVSRGATASEALTQNNAAMEQLMDALKEHDVALKDIQTSAFNVQPEFEYKRDQSPTIIGYRVTNGVSTNVRDLSALGSILDALVRAGGNQITGVQFKFKDAAALQDQARREAFRDARARAQSYAEAANIELGKIQQISEQAIHPPVDRSASQLAATESVSQVPIAPGESEVRASVTVVFTITE